MYKGGVEVTPSGRKWVYCMVAILALAGLLWIIDSNSEASIINNPPLQSTDVSVATAPSRLAAETERAPSESRKLVSDGPAAAGLNTINKPRQIAGSVALDARAEGVPNCRVWLTTGIPGNATVRETTTDAAGEFHFNNITDSDGWLEGATPEGFLTQSILLSSLDGGDRPTLYVKTARATGVGPPTLLRVLYPNGSPAADARIYYKKSERDYSNPFARNATNHAGYININSEGASFACLVLDADCQYLAKVNDRVEPGSQDTILQFSERAPRVRVRVTGPVGRKKSNISTYFVSEKWRITSFGESDTTQINETTIERMVRFPFDEARLIVTGREFKFERSQILYSNQLPEVVSIALTRLHPLSGTIVLHGKAEKNAMVELIIKETTEKGLGESIRWLDSTVVDGNGYFECYSARKETVYLQISKKGFPTQTLGPYNYDPASSSEPVKLSLEAYGELEYSLRDVEGKSIASCTIYIINREGKFLEGFTDESGSCLIKDVAPGKYEVLRRRLTKPGERRPWPPAGERTVEILSEQKTVFHDISPTRVGVTTNLRINSRAVDNIRVHYAPAPFDENLLEPGEYSLHVLWSTLVAPRYEVIEITKEPIVIREDSPSIQIDLRCGEISGTICDFKENNIGTVSLEADTADGFHVFIKTNIQKSGIFQFPSAPAGKCKIFRKATGAAVSVDVEEGKLATVELK